VKPILHDDSASHLSRWLWGPRRRYLRLEVAQAREKRHPTAQLSPLSTASAALCGSPVCHSVDLSDLERRGPAGMAWSRAGFHCVFSGNVCWELPAEL